MTSHWMHPQPFLPLMSETQMKFWEDAGMCAGEEAENWPRTNFLKNDRINGGTSGGGCPVFSVAHR